MAGSVCLGEVEVVHVTPMAILVVGGDTAGENWVPRSVVRDGESGVMRRDAVIGTVAELWVPDWFADKVPW